MKVKKFVFIFSIGYQSIHHKYSPAQQNHRMEINRFGQLVDGFSTRTLC